MRRQVLAPTCRVCGQQMQLLDEDEQGRWYCYKDNELWRDKEQKWNEPKRAWDEEQTEEEHAYDALYIDGYKDIKSDLILLSVLSNSIKVQTGKKETLAEPTYLGGVRGKVITVPVKTLFEVPYTSLEVVNITHEREITALRTFLIGPLFAAYFKQENMFLNIGFRDETGLLQTPCFKIGHGDLEKCYNTIVRRLKRAKGIQDANDTVG
jgi:hypothetical protein